MGLGKKFLGKNKLLFLIASVLLCNPLYCASKKKKNASSEPEPAVVIPVLQENTNLESESPSENSVKLPAKKRTYFYKVDQNILDSIEDGSPESIKRAVAQLRQSAVNLEENEKVLLYIATSILKNVYPSEQINWETYPVDNNNPYIGALSSVEQGIFDSSTGNVDFLATLLPALVLTKSTVKESDYPACENVINEALVLNPESTVACYLMGLLKTKQEKFDEAESYLTKVHKKLPDAVDVSIAYAKVLRMNGKLTEASTILTGITGESSALAVLKQNAYIAFDANDLNKAELYVARVLQQTPNDLEFVLFRAKILIEKNDYIHAVSLLDMYARQESSSIEYLVLRAKVQLDWSKNTVAATETVERALQLYPDNAEALMFAARISALTDSPVAGKYADELASLVLQKHPDSYDAMVYALDGLTQRENWEEAYQVCKRIISLDNVTPEIIEKFVVVCIKMNKTEEAYELSKKYYDANPDNEVLMQAYIHSYSEIGNRDAVMKYISSLLTTASPKMKSYLYYRRSFLQLTEENSLADLRSSLISNPRNSDSLFRLYEMYYGKKDYRKAQYYLRQVVAINPNDNSVKKLNEALTKLIQ